MDGCYSSSSFSSLVRQGWPIFGLVNGKRSLSSRRRGRARFGALVFSRGWASSRSS